MNPFAGLLATRRSLGPFVLRLGLAIVFFPHGAQNIFGWFGGRGLAASTAFLHQSLHIPMLLAQAAVWTQLLAPIALAFGFFTRLAAFALGTTMAVAAILVHLRYGFFMNWFGTQAGEGFEFHILAVAGCLCLLFTGGGSLSADHRISGEV
ncbi:thiosulfate dehydrogenase [quinone] large subunit [Methylacidimicrobium cyclopophantes]|uniref:Thiosulfate dehydrogenase [quinone] large subunit n=1 Tax=Methylacidimicrobium cyclopophantes TaxID=1041766 RepID=A0A5E6MDK8_9BACT|nr:DoxX family protein [Methylacidimicrobium cyclopophantes]VVM06416.1 thiosulfate dehydrogenase [quinone] large subunit [Methylacidimicrobium cyclopophantes]